MEMSFELVYQDTKALCRKLFYRIYGAKCAVYALCVGIFALMAFEQWIAYGGIGEGITAVFCLIGVPWFLLYPCFTADKTFRARMKQYNGVLPETTARFGENIRISDNLYGSEVAYGDIKKIYFAQSSITFYTADKRVYIIPTDGFTKGTLPQLRGFLLEKCPLAKVSDKG